MPHLKKTATAILLDIFWQRGLEAGLVLDDLKAKLIGHEVVIKYPKYWTPLDWNNSIRHLSKLEFKDEVIFDELKGKH